MPRFVLTNQDGNSIDSQSLVGDNFLVLFFYPKDFTPGCTAESCRFRDEMSDFTSLNARIVGISADSPESHRKFADRHKIEFSLLADGDNAVRKQFGVKPVLLGLVPGRSTFVIDRVGIVRFRTDHLGRAEDHVREAREAIERLVSEQ
jgi:thioredoxin-dependent peroxiredoxin